MTVLADTPAHLVEYEGGNLRMLTIARRTDGHCLAFRGARVAGEFRDCLATHDPERVIATYIRMAGGERADWTPLYKVARMPAHGVAV